MDRGKDTEDFVEEICKHSYLADFVVRSPKFRKISGQEKEAADLLLPFGNTAICFQIKTRNLPDHEVSEIEIERINKRIKEAVNQIKTIKRAATNECFDFVRNLRGVKIPFKCTEITSYVGIVVIDVFDLYGMSNRSHIEILHGIDQVHGIPVHVFLKSDFKILVNELDTIPDLLIYLKTREDLLNEKILCPIVRELDFLGMFLTKWGMIDDCMKGKVNMLVVEDGFWESVNEKHSDEFENRRERKELSRIIDLIIGELYRCIGFSPKFEMAGDSASQAPPVS